MEGPLFFKILNSLGFHTKQHSTMASANPARAVFRVLWAANQGARAGYWLGLARFLTQKRVKTRSCWVQPQTVSFPGMGRAVRRAMMKTLQKLAVVAAMATGLSLATAAPVAAQSFGFSLGGPGYSFSYNDGYPYGYGYGYGYRPYGYGYGPRYYYGRPTYGRPSYYGYGRPYYGRPYNRPYRGYRR